jgi:hypothetical protein
MIVAVPRSTVPTCSDVQLARAGRTNPGCGRLTPQSVPNVYDVKQPAKSKNLSSRNQWRFQLLAAVPHRAWSCTSLNARYHNGFMDEPTRSTAPGDCLSGGPSRPRSGPREDHPAHSPDDDDAVSAGP